MAAVELALRALDLGGGRPGQDPFAGFSETVELFEPGVDERGRAVWQVAGIRVGRQRDPAERRFLAEKPTNGFRVFVVGGSSAAGVPYGPSRAFSHWLERLLEQGLPGREVEVVNAALSGYATRRITTTVDEIARFAPDLLVVYAGHNEIAERRFYAHLIELPPWLFHAWERLNALRSVRLLAELLHGGDDEPGDDVPLVPGSPADDDREMFMAIGGRAGILEPPSERELAYRDLLYRSNLEQIVERMQGVGARTLLLSLSQNFSDWPPGASGERPDLDEAGRKAWRQQLGAARRLARERDRAGAIAAYEQALAVDPDHADSHFELAALLRRRDRERAERHYRLASDLDRVPHGAPLVFNRILEGVAAERGALWLDVDALLREESGSRLVGDDLFVDMVHPNLRAHQAIARAIAERLRAEGVPEPPEAWQRMGSLPDPDRLSVRGPDERLAEARVRLMACLLGRRPGCIRPAAEAVLALDPDDATARAWRTGRLR